MGSARGAALATFAAFVASVVFLGKGREFAPREVPVARVPGALPGMDSAAMATQVSRLVQLNTVSDRAEAPTHLSAQSQDNMKEAHALLRSFYPLLFAEAKVETIHDYSLLLSLPAHGSGKERPAVLMCHLDVVSIENGTEPLWGKAAGCEECGPFSGAIRDGFVWGRGSLDMKQYCVAMLYAAERLLEQNKALLDAGKAPSWVPSRPILFAVGHDEESGGEDGHAQIVQHLRQQGIEELEFVHDEGLPVLGRGATAANKGFDLGLIGLAEKGYMTVRIVCSGTGGHGSSPPLAGTAASLLASVLSRIQSHQPSPSLNAPAREMLETTAPYQSPAKAFVLSRLAYFAPLLARVMAASDGRQASITRTTTAVNVIGGGFYEAALPESAWAVLNHRLVPGDTTAQVLGRDRALLREALPVGLEDQCRADLNPDSNIEEASPVSDSRSIGFAIMAGALRAAFGPELVVSAGLFIAASDSKHYSALAPRRVFKHFPFNWTRADLDSIHGTDERVSVASLGIAARYFGFVLLSAALPTERLERLAVPLQNP